MSLASLTERAPPASSDLRALSWNNAGHTKRSANRGREIRREPLRLVLLAVLIGPHRLPTPHQSASLILEMTCRPPPTIVLSVLRNCFRNVDDRMTRAPVPIVCACVLRVSRPVHSCGRDVARTSERRTRGEKVQDSGQLRRQPGPTGEPQSVHPAWSATSGPAAARLPAPPPRPA